MEKVTRAKDLEIVAREREVELQKIEKEKALEEQRKNIANVIRERVAVERPWPRRRSGSRRCARL